MAVNYQHNSVLLNEAIDALNIRPDGIYIDGTFGRGGHSYCILSQLGPAGRLIAIDRDPQAILAANAILDARFSIIQGPFSAVKNYMQTHQLVGCIDGLLLDLGVSSPQLDDPERGFSFMRDGPLDMRFDPDQGVSAAAWLQQASVEEITYVLKTFGEERCAKRIASAIVQRNSIQPILRTKTLADLIATVMPSRQKHKHKHKHKHPATRTFQAIRIFINNELQEIASALEGAMDILAPQGRLVVMSFHSLEDRIVKNFIRQHSRRPQLPARMPLTESQLHAFGSYNLKSLGKIMPQATEIATNPRARSAVLRVAARVTPDE